MLATSTINEHPDATALDVCAKAPDPVQPTSQVKDKEAQLAKQLAGDKLVASLGGTFGRDHNSDDKEAKKT
jgi:hypothetical protein